MTECAAAIPLKFANGSESQTALNVRNWHALFVLSRHEKAVSESLTSRGIDTFLPLYETLHHWGRHKARLSLPLFPNYVFVHCSSTDRLFVLNVAAAIRIVGFNGRPAVLPEEEIETLKRLTATRNPEPYPYTAEGERVRVRTGPLRGLEGIVVRSKGSQRVVVSMHSIMRSIVFEVPIKDL